MKIKVLVPKLISGSNNKLETEIEIEAGTTIKDVVIQLREKYPKTIGAFDDEGNLRPHIILFLNDTDTRWLEDGELTQIKEGDRIGFLLALAGG
jgi:molybdopterin converting factor small subunit